MGILYNKKYIIIAGILLIIFLIVLFGYLNVTPQKQSSGSSSGNVSNNVHITSTSAVTTYYGSSYILTYPNGWSKTEQEAITGTSLILQPLDVNQSLNPYIVIEAADANLLPLSTMLQEFRITRYKETNVSVAGVPAQKYSTVLVSNEGSIHSTSYIFTAHGKNYMIKLGYKQKAVDPELENQFMYIVNNFKLQ